VPAKHTIKVYVENGFYHLFNRGVEKRIIYQDKKDYNKFTSLLERYLTNPDDLLQHLQAPRISRRSHLYKEIQLLAFCLMPNHFHLLVKQNTKDAITKFTRSLSNAYVRYFNDRYDRIGALFQGRIKGILLDTDAYLLHLTRYIHQNPLEIWNKPLRQYPFSSYPEYLDLRSSKWINTKEVLSFFRSPQNIVNKDYLSYENFVETPKEDSAEILKHFTLE